MKHIELVKKAVDIVSDNPYLDDGRYWVNCYHGCGVYRLAIKNDRIVATIHGGYHNSRPLDFIGIKEWTDTINEYITQRCGECKIVKADGSGTRFFLRDIKDIFELNIPVESYLVPDARGGSHLNLEIKESKKIMRELKIDDILK